MEEHWELGNRFELISPYLFIFKHSSAPPSSLIFLGAPGTVKALNLQILSLNRVNSFSSNTLEW